MNQTIRLAIVTSILMVIVTAYQLAENPEFAWIEQSLDAIPIWVGNPLLGLLVMFWIYGDAKDKGLTLGWMMPGICLVLPQVAPVVYFFDSRGFKGGVIGTVKYLLYMTLVPVTSAFTLIALDLIPTA